MNINQYRKVTNTQTKVAVVFVGCDATVDFVIAATSAAETLTEVAEKATNLKCGSSFSFCGLSEPVVANASAGSGAAVTIFAVFVVFRFRRDYKFKIAELYCDELFLLLSQAMNHLLRHEFSVSEETLNAFNDRKREKSNR